MHNKSVITALIGHFIERYDLALYSYFSPLFALIFFSNDIKNSIMMSLGIFVAGYIMRPVGGLLFGHMGDLYGRKKAFTFTILLVILPTLLIATLPNYSHIGILAPIILLLCRLIQGLCSGGEFGAIGIYIGEHMGFRYGFSGSLVCAIGLFGALLGNIIGALTTSPYMPPWGWRLAFFLGAILSIIGFFLRRKMKESPVYEAYKSKNKQAYTLSKVILSNKINIFCLFVIGGFGHMLLYISTLFFSIIYNVDFKLTIYNTMLINAFILLIWVVLSPIIGYLADSIGIKKFMAYQALLVSLFIYPLFFYLDKNFDFWSVLSIQIILSIISVGFVAPISGLFLSFFNIGDRCRCASFGVTLGQALLGSTAPTLAIYLKDSTGHISTVSFVISMLGILSYLSLKIFAEPINLANITRTNNKTIKNYAY